MRREGYLKKVILYNFPQSCQAGNGVKWWRNESCEGWTSNGVTREREKEWDDFGDVFLSDQATKPPYYYKALAHTWPLDQKTKCQDKTLAIGSIHFMDNHKI